MTSKIAAEAVKGVYQHVSSNQDAQYFELSKELAEKFRSDPQCGTGGGALSSPSASPAVALHTGPCFTARASPALQTGPKFGMKAL